MKQTDRFYYENGNDNDAKFSQAQLASIRGVRMASILCRTVRAPVVPTWAFLYQDPASNPLVDCRSQPDYDLRPWSNGGY